jgi:alanine racemase
MRRAWVEVDLTAIRRNLAALRSRLTPGCRILPMVKANGYGLGASRVVRALAPEQPWGFGVATSEEGLALRRDGFSGRIVVFSPLVRVDSEALVGGQLEPVVTGLEAFLELSTVSMRNARPWQVHLEVDTGMARSGLAAGEVEEWAPVVAERLDGARLRVASTFTHFHSADTDPGATRAQWSLFEGAVDRMRRHGIEPGLLHAANSAAAMLYDSYSADLVRPGIQLYGGGSWDPAPSPVARVCARVLEVRDVPSGTTVSYGATFRTDRPSRLATLAIGYGDGLRHGLSRRGVALVRGRPVPIVGAVCMDVTVVDITEGPTVEIGDVATLLGQDGGECIELESVAQACGTISYEILTGLGRRLPRVERPVVDDSTGGGS